MVRLTLGGAGGAWPAELEAKSLSFEPFADGLHLLLLPAAAAARLAGGVQTVRIGLTAAAPEAGRSFQPKAGVADGLFQWRVQSVTVVSELGGRVGSAWHCATPFTLTDKPGGADITLKPTAAGQASLLQLSLAGPPRVSKANLAGGLAARRRLYAELTGVAGDRIGCGTPRRCGPPLLWPAMCGPPW